jgi:DNA repair exonuclease SbcCD nuclease subunit
VAIPRAAKSLSKSVSTPASSAGVSTGPKAGAEANAAYPPMPPLLDAAMHGFPEVVQALLDHGADIQATEVQYCALGHWHKCAEQFPGQAFRAWFCGSPETLQFEDGEDSGFALEVVLDEGRTEVVPHRVGKYRWLEVALEVVALQEPDDVRRAIEGLAAPDRIVRVLLHGALSGNAAFDPEAIRERLADRFAHLILDTESLHTRWEDFDPETVFPPGTIGAAFIGLAQERLHAAEQGDRALWEEVLRRGTALLAGREGVG